MSQSETRRVHGGMLDVLVEQIARATASSAVFVVADAPAGGLSLLAEFPQSAAAITRGTPAEDRCTGEGPADERCVCAPIRSGESVIGWAVVVSPLGSGSRAEELVTLLARCAEVLLHQQRGDRTNGRHRHRWEDAARDGYWEWDVASGVMRFSRESLALLACDDEDSPSCPEVWLDRIHPEDAPAVFAALLSAAADSECPVDCEHRIVRRDGSISRLLVRALLERDERGNSLRLVGWLCDVSRARHIESEVRRAQSLGEVAGLAVGAAHDLNNFLTVIRAHTELALGSAGSDGAVGESLELIKHAAASATTLTRQLLSLRRRRTPVYSVIDLNEVVVGVERTLRSLVGRTNRLVTTTLPEAAHVRADASHLERLLINLVVNARDAMPDGGTVRVEVGLVAKGTLGRQGKPLSRPAGDCVTLTVRDTGVGMDDATRARIFDPFFTTKPTGRGTGLGLWIVRDVVQRCGGAVEVRSAPSNGAEFVMYFPRANPPRAG